MTFMLMMYFHDALRGQGVCSLTHEPRTNPNIDATASLTLPHTPTHNGWTKVFTFLHVSLIFLRLASSRCFWRSMLAPQFNSTMDCTSSQSEGGWQIKGHVCRVLYSGCCASLSDWRASESSLSFSNWSLMSAFPITGQTPNFTWAAKATEAGGQACLHRCLYIVYLLTMYIYITKYYRACLLPFTSDCKRSWQIPATKTSKALMSKSSAEHYGLVWDVARL